ncbi:MAG: hypothetical protein KAW12_12325, partial [Candidatus Aminicenantes bacterium]|nr:hypothetical protein [Candidatus Aminicenantes bacterium]
GGDSLYDLAARLHTIFVDLPQKLKRTKLTPAALERIKTDFVDKGIEVFSQFLRKEKRHHNFLSYLPDCFSLFAAIEKLGKYLGQPDKEEKLSPREAGLAKVFGSVRTFFQKGSDLPEAKGIEALELLEQVKSGVLQVYGFFKSLENLLVGERA